MALSPALIRLCGSSGSVRANDVRFDPPVKYTSVIVIEFYLKFFKHESCLDWIENGYSNQFCKFRLQLSTTLGQSG